MNERKLTFAAIVCLWIVGIGQLVCLVACIQTINNHADHINRLQEKLVAIEAEANEPQQIQLARMHP